jgi:integrase
MSKLVSRDGIIIGGSIIHQLKEIHRLSTNDHRFGLKVKDILSEGYTKQSNPYCRSFQTAKLYLAEWLKLGNYVRENFGINRVSDIKPQHIESYIEQKADLSPKSLKNLSSALGKLENVLNQKLGMEVNFGNRELLTGRFLANKIAAEKLKEYSSSRGAYRNPEGLIEGLSDSTYQLVAKLQYQGGLRIHEVQQLKEHSLKDGRVEVRGKGGYVRQVEIPPSTYRELREVIEREGRIRFDYKGYLNDLRESSVITDQQYQGSHGLRYNYAQNCYNSLIQQGYGHWEALKITSENMGHHRPEITLHYLGK